MSQSLSGIFLTSVLILLAPLRILSLQSTAHSSPGTGVIQCAVNSINISEHGYQLDVYLANTGSNVIRGWKVTLNFSSPAEVAGSWNATMSEVSTTSITASHVSWNRELLPGQTTSFGIQGDHNGGFATPICTPSEML